MSSRKVAACKHPKLDRQLRCKACGVLVDIREKKNKYGAKRTVVDGLSFDSTKEAKHYQDLKAMGVWPIELQPKFDLTVNGILICRYRGDFAYEIPYSDGQKCVDDVKGFKTAVYKLKKKLMLAIHGIEIREV